MMKELEECEWCGKKYESILDKYGSETNHECKDEDHVEWVESEEFEYRVHREIWTKGYSRWYELEEQIDIYKEHFKSDSDCKHCKKLREEFGDYDA